MISAINFGSSRRGSIADGSRWTCFSSPRPRLCCSSARDGLLQLDRDGKLDGRPRDKARLLPEIEAELAACQALTASPADLKALRSRPLRDACRLLRIRAGVLSVAGEWGDFVTVADAISRMDASEAEELYELGRSLARCVDLLDQAPPGPNRRSTSSRFACDIETEPLPF